MVLDMPAEDAPPLNELELQDCIKELRLKLFDKDSEIDRLKWAIDTLKQESFESYGSIVQCLEEVAKQLDQSDSGPSLDIQVNRIWPCSAIDFNKHLTFKLLLNILLYK